MKHFINDYGYQFEMDDDWQQLSYAEISEEDKNSNCIDFYFNLNLSKGVGFFYEGNLFINDISDYFKFSLEKLQSSEAEIIGCQTDITPNRYQVFKVSYVLPNNEEQSCCFLQLNERGDLGKIVSSDMEAINQTLKYWRYT